MGFNPLRRVQRLVTATQQWWKRTPERAIEQAFQAAINIKKIEDEFFNGQPISDTAGYSSNTYNLFKVQLERNLQTIKLRLAEYRASVPLPFTSTDGSLQKVNQPLINPYQDNPTLVQKLAFIDYILERYRVSKQPKPVTPQPVQLLDATFSTTPENPDRFTLLSPSPKEKRRNEPPPSITPVEKTIIPGSFFRAFERIRRTVTGAYFSYERDFVDELRQVRQRDRTAIRFLTIIFLAFIATQVLSKYLIFSPVIDYFFPVSEVQVQFSPAFQEQAFEEYRLLRDRLELQGIIDSLQPPERRQELSARREEELRTEVQRLIRDFNRLSLDGIKNLFADVTASFVFYMILITNRRQVALVKEFFDEILYSLNDSAKAFLIIVATDTFVGFHSSEGWDALLYIIFQHFGIAENAILNKTFIATVPVFLDGLFKFWIFQYLRQSSPSTAAIFSEMNQ